MFADTVRVTNVCIIIIIIMHTSSVIRVVSKCKSPNV